MLGATTPYVMVWIVNVALGPVAAGVLGACTTLVGITRVLQAGVTNVLTTQASHAFATGGYPALRRVLWRSAMFLGLTLGGVCLLLLFAGDFLAVLVFGEFYDGTRPILVALGLSALFAAWSVVAGNGLWAIEKAPANFVADIWATAVTLAVAAVLVLPMGALGAALATLVGSIVATALRVVALARAVDSSNLHSETVAAP
jgi:O-antigen/teichoic acid export membrane protein